MTHGSEVTAGSSGAGSAHNRCGAVGGRLPVLQPYCYLEIYNLPFEWSLANSPYKSHAARAHLAAERELFDE